MTPVIAWPLLAALALALLPRLAAVRARPAVMPVAALAAALPVPVLAVIALLVPVSAAPDGSWLSDRLSLSLQLLLTVPLVLVSGWRLPGRPARPGWVGSIWPATAQLGVGGGLVAVRAADLFPALIGLALSAAAVVLLLPRREMLALMLAGILLVAWLGIACLTAGQGSPAAWAELPFSIGAVPPSLRFVGLAALTLPMLLLAWIASAGSIGDRVPGPDELSARALLPVLLGAPALDVVLRLRALPDAAPALLRPGVLLPMAGGLLGMALGCVLMPARPLRADRLMLLAALQLGAVAVGFGVGGTGGVLAGLMLLSGLALALPTALLPMPGPLGRGLNRLAVLALAGLPPFVPFAAGFVLLLRLFAALPLVALLMLAAFAIGSRLLVAARPGDGISGNAMIEPAAPTRRVWTDVAAIPALLALGLLGWLGLATPPALSSWLLAASEALAGPPWPVPVAATPP